MTFPISFFDVHTPILLYFKLHRPRSWCAPRSRFPTRALPRLLEEGDLDPRGRTWQLLEQSSHTEPLVARDLH